MSISNTGIGRFEIENALESGNLWVAMTGGRYWKARRNGQTKRWKREALRFEIPFKVGLKACGRVTDTDVTMGNVSYDKGYNYLISDTDPNV